MSNEAKFGYVIAKHQGLLAEGFRPLSVRAVERGTREPVGLGDEDDIRVAVFGSQNEAVAEMQQLCGEDTPGVQGLSVRSTYDANLWGTVWELVGVRGFVVPANPWTVA